MKVGFYFTAVALLAGPAIAQQSPLSPSVVPSPKAIPCDPIAPEVGPNGDPIYTGCQIKALGGSPPKLISAPKAPDLTKLYQQGIQGEVVFNLIVGKDGLPHNVISKISSRSPELDAIALKLVSSSTFSPALDREGKPIDARATYPAYFWKDSFANPEFSKKKCAQFLIDTGWHAANFPEEKPEEYRGWLLANGMMVASLIKLRDFKPPVYSYVVESCKNTPHKLFFDVLYGR